jgi:hypothetical protein
MVGDNELFVRERQEVGRKELEPKLVEAALLNSALWKYQWCCGGSGAIEGAAGSQLGPHSPVLYLTQGRACGAHLTPVGLKVCSQ